MKKTKASPPHQLGDEPDSDAIWDRLSRLLSPPLLDVLYNVAKEQLSAEDKREGLLIAKANALLGVTGLSLTVTFTFGGFLLQRASGVSGWVLGLYSAALLAALGAALCALVAMRVQESRAVGAKDVFNEQALQSAHAADLPPTAPPAAASPIRQLPALETLLVVPKPYENVVATGIGAAAYKRYLVSHYWGIYGFNSTRHENTARWVQRGQVFYGAFLLAIMLTGAFLGANVKLRSDNPQNDAGVVAQDSGSDAAVGASVAVPAVDAGQPDAGAASIAGGQPTPAPSSPEQPKRTSSPTAAKRSDHRSPKGLRSSLAQGTGHAKTIPSDDCSRA